MGMPGVAIEASAQDFVDIFAADWQEEDADQEGEEGSKWHGT